jgi:hypothetical protein
MAIEMKTEIFVNMTCGLEILPYLEGNPPIKVNFIRLQSTLLEQGHHEAFIKDLDYNFLMYLALGYECLVFDYTSRWKDRPSRAIWQGLELVKYCLNRCWFGKEIECPKGMHVYFKKSYDGFDKKTKRKLKYFRKFLFTDELRIESQCDKTDNDGNTQFYREVLEKWKDG